MNSGHYSRINIDSRIILRCPILNLCMRRVLTIYYFSDHKDEERGRGIIETLLDDGIVGDDFVEKKINLCGEAPIYSKEPDFMSFCNMCPEVNLYDSEHALNCASGTACVSGNYDKDRTPRFNPVEYRHYTQCPEYNSIHFINRNFKDRASKGKRPRISRTMRFEKFLRDNFKCTYCGRGKDDNTKLVLDHKVPYSDGGGDTFENLVTACYECNEGKSNKRL